jgi:CRP/FNR family transcriptional regulator
MIDMPTPHAIDHKQTALTCTTSEIFKTLPPIALAELAALEIVEPYAASQTLFEEKQAPTRVFILLEGQVKLSMNSIDGKRLILRIARPGEFLGLTSVLSGTEHEMMAETLYPCKIASLRRQDFLNFLLRYPAAYESLARCLSNDYSHACEHLRTVGLASTAPIKLARLLLEWCTFGQQTELGTRLRMTLTHGEIGECIGTSRETVTRTLSDFKHRQLVDMRGSTLMIPNRMALANYAEM